jgi:hypothetical protein
MSNTAIQTAPSLAEPPAPAVPTRPRTKSLFSRVLWALASLRLTVVLFVLSLLLVFFGTLAQIDQGNWTIVTDYFRSFNIVWVRWQLLVQFGQVFFGLPKTMTVPGAFPFPGGLVLGSALRLNLLAAHLVRFKVSWKRSGILLIHAGLIVMLLGEFITGLAAIEGNMTIDEGTATNYVEHRRFFELAVVRPSATEKDKEDVTVVPESFLRKKALISNDDLPFDIQPVQYMVNSSLRNLKSGDDPSPATKGAGLAHAADERREGSGVDTEQAIDIASCYLQLLDKQGNDLGTYLFSAHLKPQEIEVGGKKYEVTLRFRRTYKPYSIHLIKFSFDRYMGTSTAKNYSSLVRVIDPERGEGRQVLIRMNQPLRYRDDALYQQSFDPRTETTTVLQVVRNPAWLMPYLSCGIVSLGMFVHFGISLNGFLRRRASR